MIAARIAVCAAVAFDVVVAEVAVDEVARAARVDVVVLVVALDVVRAAVGARVAGGRSGSSCRRARPSRPRDVPVVAEDDVLGGVAENRVAAVGLRGRALGAADDVVLVVVAVHGVAVAATGRRPAVDPGRDEMEVGVDRREGRPGIVERKGRRAVPVALHHVVAAAAAHEVVGSSAADHVGLGVAVQLVGIGVALHRVGAGAAAHQGVVRVAEHHVAAGLAVHPGVAVVAVHRVHVETAAHSSSLASFIVGAGLAHMKSSPLPFVVSLPTNEPASVTVTAEPLRV